MELHRTESEDSYTGDSISDSSGLDSPRHPRKKPVEAKLLTTEESFYDNFETIDWIRDGTRDRLLRDRVDDVIGKKGSRVLVFFTKLFYKMQAWIILSLIAALTGVLAAAIDIPVDWLSDTRFGYCTQGFWLSSSLCCQEFSASSSEPIMCEKWKTWGMIFGLKRDSIPTFLINYLVYVIAGVLFATTSAVFVKVFAPTAAGSGIAEVKTILGGFVIREFASAKTLLVKCVGLVLSVSSGLNLGKEGPMIHVACCCADLFSKIFTKYSKNQAKKRELYSAAAAAGVAVAFGAPIGGVLFSLEEVSYYFPHKVMWRTMYTAALSALILMYINPFHTGKIVIFQVAYTHSWLRVELIPFFILSILGGLLGVVFIKLNVRLSKFRKSSWLSHYPIQEVMVVAAITGMFNYINPYLRGNTGQLIAELFADCDPTLDNDLCNPDKIGITIVYLLLATLIRLGMTIFTFGIKVPAGIFIPPIAIGASLGRAVGLMVQWYQISHPDSPMFAECEKSSVCINPGVFALVGAAATLSGFTRITVSLVVIMFELTGELSYIVPFLTAVLISKWTSDAFVKGGIYESKIIEYGYPFLDNKSDYRFETRAVDVMTRASCVLEADGHTVGSLSAFLNENHYTGYPIVNNKEDMIIVGFISRAELRQGLEQAHKDISMNDDTPCYFGSGVNDDGGGHKKKKGKPNMADFSYWVDETPLQISSSTPLNLVYDMFKKLGLRYILVAHRGVLIGIITKKDILQHIASLQNKNSNGTLRDPELLDIKRWMRRGHRN
eukprot:TRINITY_DN2888_c0_g1_i2.p1 TRINITY_DN2888_c0_g1~~TRINITY_DN2888_c0_g1_i2.p1  ORF type:complete len:778 (-),score=208.47 TRINITY_DN2888_c0_g1_i2:41-2374(-)